MKSKTEFYLKNYTSLDSIEFSFNSKKILIDFDSKKNDERNKIQSELNSKSEIGLLTIIDESDHEKSKMLANDIIQLLSFAVGKNVIFERFIHDFQGQSQIFNQKKVFNPNFGQEIIPYFCLKNYLEETLSNYSNMSSEQKKDFLILTDYLNQTSNHYIEDRILRIAQAWECASKFWITENIELSEELKDLRKKIKAFFDNWKKENNFLDINGKLGQKITGSIDEEINLIKLKKLCSLNKLNEGKINLDLKKLKDMRDAVAHTGRIKSTGISAGDAIFILLSAIQGLQLIMLKRLGYTSLVNGIDNYGIKENGDDNFGTIMEIEHYFL